MQTRIFQAKDEELVNATSFLEEELEKVDCPMKIVMQFSVCLEEMFVNVAHYAYDGGDGSVSMSIDIENDVISVTLEDAGKPFDPLKKDDPDITLSAEERNIGGLGIFMVKKTMDEVSYEYKNNKNIFCMRKRLA